MYKEAYIHQIQFYFIVNFILLANKKDEISFPGTAKPCYNIFYCEIKSAVNIKQAFCFIPTYYEK